MKRPRESSIAGLIVKNVACKVDADCVLYSMLKFLDIQEVLRVLAIAFPKSVVMRNAMFWPMLCDQFLSSFVKSAHWTRRGLSHQSVSRFFRSMHTFRSPYGQRRILLVTDHDSVAYVNFKIDSARLMSNSDPQHGVYLEASVHKNPDSLSLCLVDFDGNGSSSLTFSPDAGAVIKERKVYSSSGIRNLSGEYCNPLPLALSFGNEHSRSAISVYISSTGEVSFYRKKNDIATWECTGSMPNVSQWLTGSIITPCIAFRDPGDYDVRIERISTSMPADVAISTARMQATNTTKYQWKTMTWEGDEREDINTFFVESDSEENEWDA